MPLLGDTVRPLQERDAGSLLDQQLEVLVGHARQVRHLLLTRIDRADEDLVGASDDALDHLLRQLVGAFGEVFVLTLLAGHGDVQLGFEGLVLAAAGDLEDVALFFQPDRHLAVLPGGAVDHAVAGLALGSLAVEAPADRLDNGGLACPVAVGGGAGFVLPLDQNQAAVLKVNLG